MSILTMVISSRYYAPDVNYIEICLSSKTEVFKMHARTTIRISSVEEIFIDNIRTFPENIKLYL